MTGTADALPGERRLHLVAGVSAFLAMLANIVDVVLGFGGEMVTYGARPAPEWFSVSSGFALLLAVLATGIYISSNAAVPMLELAQQHAAATTDLRRWALVGAGEAVLARGEDFTPGTFIGLFLSDLAAIVVSVVMLRGRVFARINALAGTVGFSCLTPFTFIATFVQGWYTVAFYLFGGAGGLLALAWFAMTGRRFLTLKA